MNFGDLSAVDVCRKIPKHLPAKTIGVNGRGKDYTTAVNYYAFPPEGEITLDEAEQWVHERLSILSKLDEMKSYKGPSEKYSEELETKFLSIEGPNFYKEATIPPKDQLQKARRRDHVSHFLLRLYYCKDEKSRQWLLEHETELLRHRLKQLCTNQRLNKEKEKSNLETIKQFLDAFHLDFEETAVPVEMAFDDQKSNPSHVYKMHWTDALELVRNRLVYLEKGYAYVIETNMISIIIRRFKIEMKQALVSMVLDLPRVSEGDRLIPRIHNSNYEVIVKKEMAVRAAESGGSRVRIYPDQIDDLAKESFPPCMKAIHDSLRQTHHLKVKTFYLYTPLIVQLHLALWTITLWTILERNRFNTRRCFSVFP